MPAVTVVLPVYNVEEYVHKCVDSVKAQTLQDWRMIIVDDGSTDGSGKECDQIASGDNRISVIHQENRGLSAARNVGLEYAKTEFVCFIDSDDYVFPTFLEKLVDLISPPDIQMAAVGIIDRYVNKEEISFPLTKATTSYEDFFKLALIGSVPGSICNRIFRVDAIKNLRFSVGRTYEDMFFNATLLGYINKVAFDMEPLYVYEHRIGSITTKPFSINAVDCILASIKCVDKSKYCELDVQKAAEFRFIWSMFNVLDRLLVSDNQENWINLKKKLVRTLRGFTLETLYCPYFASTRKISAVALLCGTMFYKVLLMLQRKRFWG